MKLSPVQQVVKGKRVVMVDDSIVRGTTSKRIVKMLKEAGATEVHVVIASPPLVSPCFYGVDISTDSELIATNRTVEEICELIEADSLTFLSPEGMIEAIGRPDETKNCGQCLLVSQVIIRRRSFRIQFCHIKKKLFDRRLFNVECV